MKWLLSVALVILLPIFGFAQIPIRSVDSILDRLNHEDGFSGNVLISERGKIIYEKSFGFANYENKIPLTENTIFSVGSISKTLTATAILKLKEQGRLKLDDLISKYLPDLPYKNMTVRHLLTHTSGLPEYQSDAVIKEIEGKGVSNLELEKTFARLKFKPDFEPGSKWQYSNTNFIFLALIIEKVSGKSYPKFLRENIFEPAGMKKTFVLKSNIPDQFKNDMADGYRSMIFVSETDANINSLRGALDYYKTVGDLYGAGGIYSTVRDLEKFHRALQKNKILKKETFAEMYEPAKLNDGQNFSALRNTNYESEYGFGWFIAKDYSAGKIVYHPGATVGFVSYFLRNITKDQCVIILTNNEMMRHYTATAVMRVLNNQPYKLDNKSLAKALGKEYLRGGLESARKLFDKLKNDPDFSFREGEMNDLGYQLILDKKDAEAAIEILKINAEKFPESFNVWDSLGEIYYKAGFREEAIKNYEKSLELNPQNKEGKQMLEKIKKETVKP